MGLQNGKSSHPEGWIDTRRDSLNGGTDRQVDDGVAKRIEATTNFYYYDIRIKGGGAGG